MIKRPNKGPAPPKELFALGTKVKPDSELKTSFGLKKLPGSAMASGPSLKRDRDQMAGSSSGIVQAAKRSRLGSGVLQTLGRSSDTSENKFAPAVHLYEDIAIEVDGVRLVEHVMNSLNDTERVEGLLCGAVKNLKSSKLKPDEAMYVGVMYLAKSKPEIFQSEVVTEAFCSMLKKETNPNLKLKMNNLLSVVACNVFVTALQDKPSWPDSFVKVYLDDSLGDRMWVDQAECRTFVENVLTAFGTKLPKNMFQVDPGAKPDTPVQLDSEEAATFIEKVSTGTVMERYAYQLSTVEPYVMDVIRDQLSRRQPLDGGSRNLVQTLTFLCGLSEIRTLVVQRLDIWLQSPKLMKVAQDLLMSICINFNPKKYPQDLELINSLCRIRFKTKNLSSYFNLCLRELLAQNADNLPLLLQHVVACELSNARNQNNLNFMNVMLQHSPEEVVKLLAEIILEQLMVREDHLKALRVLLREIMRFSKADFKLNTFIYNLLQDTSQSRISDLDPLVKERYVTSVIDLVSMTMLLCANNSAREVASNPRAEFKEAETLRELQNQISTLQRDAICWLHSVVVKMMQIKSSDYMLCLRKVLFVEKPEVYSRVDNWPPESERGSLFKLVSEVPLQEDMLLYIVLMGHNKELHLSIPELIDLLEIIIRRAASIHSESDFYVLKVDNTDFMAALLNLCAYKHPENSVLPKGYKPPTLAIMSFYWKAWQILLIISAFNPNTIGLKAWECYPTLKCLMEMSMTNNFCFPPVTMAFDEASAEEIKSQEKQMVEYFKQQTLEFECHLAGSIITETNSRLLPQVCRMEIEGFLLKPPQSVLDSVRLLNQSLSLGKLLCQSREPADFLLNIIQRQGTSRSMPWLKDLVESNDSSLEVLPVQCLCEFLLHDIHGEAEPSPGSMEKKQQKNLKQEQLLARLENLVRSSSGEPKVMELINQTISYFFERLSFSQSYSRRQATKCLSLILGRSRQEEEEEEVKVKSGCGEILSSYQWLFEGLTSLSHFETIKMQIFLYIRAACQVETNIAAISAYIVFLSHHSNSLNLHDLDDLVLDIAQLILERVSLVSCLLPQEQNDATAAKDPRLNLVLSSLLDLFYCHLSKARQPRNETYSWSNNQYQILLHWSSGQSAKMNILIVHATVIILAYGPPEGESHFNELMDAWFPQNEQAPTAYLIDTSEEALLIPDWLKLRMIRSNVPRLIDASFGDAEVPQLLLFIQSFGISVHSMNKLLHHLDASFENNKSELLRLVLDKNYMAELIEVQHMRGAVGGEKFYKMLTGGQQKVDSKQDDILVEPLVMGNKFTTKAEISVKDEETSSSEVVELLTKVFLDYETSKAEKSCALRTLHRSGSDVSGLMNMVESCTKIICSPNGTSFMDSLFKNTTYSCPLFKQIISGCCTSVANDLCEVVLSRSNNQSNLLTCLLKEHLGKLGGTSLLQPHQSVKVKEETHDAVNDHMTEEQITNALKNMVNQPSKVKGIVNVLISFTKHHDNISNTTRNLYHLHDATRNTLYSGLVLDCLELFNPQIIQPDLLEELLGILFKRESVGKHEPMEISNPKSPTCGEDDEMEGIEEKVHKTLELFPSQNEYLLCLLLHRCGWSNLIQVINHLLPKFTPNAFEGMYQNSTILDFIEACFNVPNLWQGRDKRISKHQPIEDILSLNVNQVSCLASITVKEQLRKEGERFPLDEDKVASRLNLIESCCAGKMSKLRAVVQTFLQMQETDDTEVVAAFLWGMYLRVPQVFVKVPHKLRLTERCLERLFTDESQLDIGTQRMITCLLDVNLSSGRMDDDRLLQSTMVSRKMASQHPIIFLRQLSLLSSFLVGHVQFLCAEVKVRNLSPMLTNALGIIYLLQPYIFHSFHAATFHSIIDSYAQIISVYGFSARHLNGLVKKFLEIIFNYFNHCPMQAYSCLKKHLSLLRRLDKQYDDFRMLQRFLLRLICFDEAMEKKLSLGNNMNSELALVGNISKSSSEEMFTFTFTSAKSLPSNLAVKATPIWEVSRFFTLVQKTDRSYAQTTAELVEGLKELDELSRAHVDILGEFTDNIEKLLQDFNTDCRDAGYALMMRLLRYNPKFGKVFCSSLKKCLENENLQIVQSSLDSLKEFTVLAQDHAAEVLVSAFKAGIAWSLDVTPYINETLQILNLRLMSPS